jgi:hypothetical protein
MAWTIYQLRFRALSQIHIGYQKIGNVQRTRSHIPARVLWAALTARLTRGGVSGQLPQPVGIARGDYEQMGECVRRQMAFSYFYFTDDNGQALLPYYKRDGLCYSRAQDENSYLTPEALGWRYFGSYASTALDYTHSAADESTLHEVEFISAQTRSDAHSSNHPVEFTGYLLIADGCELPWQKALQEVQVGGERSYGWGRLKLMECQEVGIGTASLFGWMQCTARDSGRPRVEVKPNKPLLAHTEISGIEAVGEIEPFVSRVWHQGRGAGQEVQVTGVCYAPGSRLESSQPQWFEWTTAHIWEITHAFSESL